MSLNLKHKNKKEFDLIKYIIAVLRQGRQTQVSSVRISIYYCDMSHTAVLNYNLAPK